MLTNKPTKHDSIFTTAYLTREADQRREAPPVCVWNNYIN